MTPVSNGAIAGWTPQADFTSLQWVKSGNGDYDADGFANTFWLNVNTLEIGI